MSSFLKNNCPTPFCLHTLYIIPLCALTLRPHLCQPLPGAVPAGSRQPAAVILLFCREIEACGQSTGKTKAGSFGNLISVPPLRKKALSPNKEISKGSWQPLPCAWRELPSGVVHWASTWPAHYWHLVAEKQSSCSFPIRVTRREAEC